jgi:hypothetical protein
MLYRAALVITAVAAFAAPQICAAGTDHVDEENFFRVTIPDGWTTIRPEVQGKVDMVLQSPRFETTRGVCPLAADPFPSTNGMTQDKINEEVGANFGEAFWKSAFGQGASQVIIDESGSELRDGKRVHLAKLRILGKVNGADVWVQMRVALHLIPGQIAMAACAVWFDHAASEDADIGGVLGSFEPLGIKVVAQMPAPAPATLVLFAGPRFDGARRELARDMPNVWQAGWTVPVASFALRGYGLWEVCDGVNYSGNCTLLAGAGSAEAKGRVLRVGSARRVFLQRDLRNALGVIADNIANVAAEARAQHARPRRR